MGGSRSGQSRDRGAVVFVTTSLGHYGADAQVVALALAFVHRGWRVGVVSLMDPERSTDELTSAGIGVASLGMRRGVPDPRSIWRLRRILREWRPMVVHAHMIHASLLTRVARLLAPMPVLISTGHNEDEQGAWRYVAARITHRAADIITYVSEGAARQAARRGAAPIDRIQVVPNGIDISPYALAPAVRRRTRAELGIEHRFTWMAIGRLTVQKDYPTLFAAFRIVLRDHPQTKLLIAGDGPLGEELEAAIGDLGLQSDVALLGLRNDVRDLLQASDAYVMSSAWEGLPIALLEAAASSLPIVATAVGGNAEVVLDGISGFIIPPRDPAALASAMVAIMSLDETRRAELGAAGRSHVTKRYGLDDVVETWISIYDGAIERKRPA